MKKRFQFLVIQGDVLISFNYPDNPYELIIEPNNQITGYPPYCSIDYVYQYILVESYADENCFEDPYSSGSGSYVPYYSNFEPIIYEGNTNQIDVKLCHNYCERCSGFSSYDYAQNCLSCVSEYQYDYLYYADRAEENPDNCVPKDYYYDKETNQLSKCESTNYFYYINTTDHRKIYFKKEDENNPCPIEYPLYNEDFLMKIKENVIITNRLPKLMKLSILPLKLI